MDFVKLIAALKAMIARWPKVHAILIEEASNGLAAISMLQTAGLATVIPLKTLGGKNSWAMSALPCCEAGDVMIPRAAPWRDSWLHELAVFPNGANDDQVDSFTQAINHIRGKPAVAALLASCNW
jgi:predicted phage terminase large subunit-like protein